MATVVENSGSSAFNDLHIDKSATRATPGRVHPYDRCGTPARTTPERRRAHARPPARLRRPRTAPGTAEFTCNQSGGVVNCIGATIKSGGVVNARHITITVTAPNQNTTITNQAVVDPDDLVPEGDEENNSDTADTTIQSVINLKITKEGPEKASQSEVDHYKIHVKNEKPASGSGATAFGVEMHDPLPIGLIPLAVDAGSGNNWACQVAENAINVVDCLGDLNPDQEVTIDIAVFMTAETNRSLDNEACVDPDRQDQEFAARGDGQLLDRHHPRPPDQEVAGPQGHEDGQPRRGHAGWRHRLHDPRRERGQRRRPDPADPDRRAGGNADACELVGDERLDLHLLRADRDLQRRRLRPGSGSIDGHHDQRHDRRRRLLADHQHGHGRECHLRSG